MNLALAAAPYNINNDKTDNINNNQESYISKKKRTKSIKKQKTSYNEKIQQKNPIKNDKVQSAMFQIYNNMDSEDNEYLGDYDPIPSNPESAGVNRTIEREEDDDSKENYANLNGEDDNGDNIDNDESINSHSDISNMYAESYYNQFMPQQPPTYQVPKRLDSDDINTKLAYLIELLEQEKKEKTDHMTEEIILYGFLGVFVIYVVDSFVRIGKYTR
jgi:hypothetical protein